MTDLIPKLIADKTTLQEVSEAFASASSSVRAIEENRKSITQPLNASLDAINDNAKKEKAPHQEIIDLSKSALSDWRRSPEVQEHYAKIKLTERKLREAQKEGDEKAITLVGENLNALTAELPKSLPVSNGSIRFTERLKLTRVDEAELDDRYFVVRRVVDEDRVKEDIELMGSVRGVEHEWSYSPAFYEDKN